MVLMLCYAYVRDTSSYIKHGRSRCWSNLESKQVRSSSSAPTPVPSQGKLVLLVMALTGYVKGYL